MPENANKKVCGKKLYFELSPLPKGHINGLPYLERRISPPPPPRNGLPIGSKNRGLGPESGSNFFFRLGWLVGALGGENIFLDVKILFRRAKK